MPKKYTMYPCTNTEKKKERLQQFNMYIPPTCTHIHMYLASLPIRPQGTGSRLPLLLLLSSSLYLSYTYPVYLKVYVHVNLHRSSLLLHVLKKAKRLKESFSESVSSVCYLLPPRRTYLMKRDVDYLPYTYMYDHMYDLVYNTLSHPFYRRYQVGKYQVGTR